MNQHVMSTPVATQDAERPAGDGATPAQLGIGMRLSIHPHCDDFADVVLRSLDDVGAAGLAEGLVVKTDEVSTYVGARTAPAEQRLVAYAAGLLTAAHRRSGGGHVVAHVLLSRGCPGEVTCDLSVTGLPEPAPVQIPATGVRASAQWSLYPLLDGDDGGSNGGSNDGTTRADHMAHIEDAIESARHRGAAGPPAHYATPLTGDVADVLATAADAWAAVGARVPHVVTHLTVSVGSPTGARA